MVREPAAVLSRAGLAAAALAVVDVLFPRLPSGPVWLEVASLALVSIPLATVCVRELLPLSVLPARALAGLSAAAVAVAALLIVVGLDGLPATIAKLVAAALVGMALASLLESTIEIVVIALLIAAVDVYSVAAGPTKVIVEQHEQVLNAFTLAFHPIGSDGVAQIGSSDFVFFALFLAAAARLHLRIALTWSAMTLSFGLTLVLSCVFDAALPALPLLSLGFLAANGDLLLARFGGRAGSPERE